MRQSLRFACLVLSASACRDTPNAPKVPDIEPSKGVGAADTPPPLELTAHGRSAFGVISHTQRFTDGAIGDGGETPAEVSALRVLIQDPGAAPALRRIYAEGSTGAKLYALCGMWFVDRSAFTQHVHELAAHTGTVEYQSGCMIDERQAVADLVRSDRAHVVRLRGPDQRVKDWARQAGMLEGGYWLDIEGGGIPDDLVMDGGWAEH